MGHWRASRIGSVRLDGSRAERALPLGVGNGAVHSKLKKRTRCFVSHVDRGPIFYYAEQKDFLQEVTEATEEMPAFSTASVTSCSNLALAFSGTRRLRDEGREHTVRSLGKNESGR